MRVWLCLIAALLSVAPAWAIDTERAYEDDAMQARYQRLIAAVRCLTCQNQSIKDSNAPLANDLRREIREQMAAGKSDKQIYTFLQERYGDFALYRPPLSARTALLWFSPAILMLIGGFAIYRVISRRSALDTAVDGD